MLERLQALLVRTVKLVWSSCLGELLTFPTSPLIWLVSKNGSILPFCVSSWNKKFFWLNGGLQVFSAKNWYIRLRKIKEIHNFPNWGYSPNWGEQQACWKFYVKIPEIKDWQNGECKISTCYWLKGKLHVLESPKKA
jgi:hypothetical protein